MEFLKKSWKWIVGFIGFFIGLVWMMNTNSSKKVKNEELKKIKKKKPVVKKKSGKEATNSLKNRLKKNK